MKNAKQKSDHRLGDDTSKVLDAVMEQADGRAYMPLSLSAIRLRTGLSLEAVTEALNELNESGKLQLILSMPDEDNEDTAN